MSFSSCNVVILQVSSIEVVFLCGHLYLRSSFCEVIFPWGCFPVRLSFCGYIPMWFSFCEVIFQWSYLTVRPSSSWVIFHTGRQPYRKTTNRKTTKGKTTKGKTTTQEWQSHRKTKSGWKTHRKTKYQRKVTHDHVTCNQGFHPSKYKLTMVWCYDKYKTIWSSCPKTPLDPLDTIVATNRPLKCGAASQQTLYGLSMAGLYLRFE